MNNGQADKTNSKDRCFYDVLREISLEFEIPEVSDINQINQCQLNNCSGREFRRDCYTPCSYNPESVGLDFKKALIKDEIKKRRNGNKILKPKIVHMDVSKLCGNPVVDRFFNKNHFRIRERNEETNDDYSEVREYFLNHL